MGFYPSYFAGGTKGPQLYQIALDIKALISTLKSNEFIDIFGIDVYGMGMTKPHYELKSSASAAGIETFSIYDDGNSMYIDHLKIQDTSIGACTLYTLVANGSCDFLNRTAETGYAGTSYIYYVKYRQS